MPSAEDQMEVESVVPTPAPSKSPSPANDEFQSEKFRDYIRKYCKRNDIASPKEMNEDQRTDAIDDWRYARKAAKAAFDF